MRKPAIIRAPCWLARRAPQAFESVLRVGALCALNAPWRSPVLAGMQRRIYRFRGEEASPARLRANFRAMASLYADRLATLFTLTPQEASRWRERIELPALAAAQRLREEGKGVILATPRFGNTTLALLALANAGLPLTAVFLNAEPLRWLKDYGLRAVSLGWGDAELAAALARNEAVLLFCGDDVSPEARTMDLFGAPVRPPHAPARLALTSGAPILPVYAVFEDGRHRLECDDPLWPSQSSGQQALEWELLRSMETFIGRHPDHWLAFDDPWDVERLDRRNRRRFAGLQAYRKFKRSVEPGFRP